MIYKTKPRLTEAQERGDEFDPYIPIRHRCEGSGLVVDAKEGELLTCKRCGETVKVELMRHKQNWQPLSPALAVHGRGVIAWTDDPDDMSDPNIVARVDAMEDTNV